MNNPNIFAKNRPFFTRMRNSHYQLAYSTFLNLVSLTEQKPYMERDVIRQLDDFIAQLGKTLDYAIDATKGLKRKKLKMYREDKHYGVLEEEIVLVFFLKEMISSTLFLRKRFETDLKMRIYRNRIEKFKAGKPEGEGFLGNILKQLDAMAGAETIEIDKLVRIMDKRYRIGHDLFTIILNKSAAHPPPEAEPDRSTNFNPGVPE